jgi:hypothetical protein
VRPLPLHAAALLIEVDPDRVVIPEFREPDTESVLALLAPS